MPSAVVYVRISQDATGAAAGVTRQRDDCIEFCAGRGYDVVEVVTDNDISASSYTRKTRPGYRRVLDLVDEGVADAIVAWHLDRLWRRPRELEDLIDRAERGLTVVTLTGEYDLQNRDHRFAARILASVAAKSSDDASARIRRAKAEAARRGEPSGGVRAFGYLRGPGQNGTTVDPTEAQLVREATDRVLAGTSLTRLAREWTDRGIPTPQNGKAWTATTLRTVLTNPRLAGLRATIERDSGKRQGWEILGDATWPAIITREEHERLARLLLDPSRASGPRRRSLLTRFVRCGKCDGIMSRDKINGRPSWRCRKSPGTDNCGGTAILAEPLDEIVVEATLHRLDSPALARAMRKPKKRRHDTGDDLADLERQLEELAEDLGAGRLTRREWLAARGPLEQRIEAARAQIATANGTTALAPLVGVDVRAAWDELDLDRRRAVLGALIDRVVVAPATKRSTFDPDRIAIEWKA